MEKQPPRVFEKRQVRNYRPVGSLHRKSGKKVVKIDEKIQVSKSKLENYRPVDGITF